MEMYVETNNGKRRLTLLTGKHDHQEKCEYYEEIMIAENDISAFLSYEKTYIDNVEKYEYDIDSMISLVDYARIRSLAYTEITMIVNAVSDVREAVFEYLLSMEGLTLNPEYIFYDKIKKILKFCFNVKSSNDIYATYLQLGEFLLSAVNYDDDEAVMLVYDIYAATLNKDYEFKKLIKEKTTNTTDSSESQEVITEDTCNNQPEKINGPEKHTQIPKFKSFSIICTTVAVIIILLMLLLILFYRKLFVYLISDSKVASVLILLFSICVYFPVMNILDINHVKRLVRR